METTDDRPFEWLVVLTEAQQVRALCDLLTEAGVEFSVRRDPDPSVESRWEVWVPADDLPVGAGVADHFLDWFRATEQGDTPAEECIAALDATDDLELEAALARERATRARRVRIGQVVVIGGLAFAVIAMASRIVGIFGG